MLSIIIVCLLLSTITNGLAIREAPQDGSIDETINVFTTIADDKNFTSVQSDVNKTSNANSSDVVLDSTSTIVDEKEKAEKEEDKIELPANVEETVNSSSSPSPSSSPSSSSPSSNTITSTSITTTTTTSTSTPKPLDSSSVTTVNKTMVISMNNTDPIMDNSFATNDTMEKEMISSLNSILIALNGTNETPNTLDTSSGGMSSSNDEFANYFELLDKLDGLEVLFEADQ